MYRFAEPGKHSRTAPVTNLVLLAAILALASSLLAQTAGGPDISVTAVRGESWINHLHKSFIETSMGKTWDLGPAPPEPGDLPSAWQLDLTNGYASQILTLHGSDLYRLNCRGCHGELGLGAPPEINAVTGPVRATSVAATMERMKLAGREMSRSDVSAIAKESKSLLLERLHMGGLHMPPPTLSDTEIRSLVAYLELLSDVPGAASRQVAAKESSYRIGEHIVKSTCHVCHSSTGQNPDAEQLYEGAIPPLSSLTSRVSLPDFVRKVTAGAPIAMGTPPAPYRGRMPVFTYLTHDEAAAAYLYLMLYPPQP
jgi:mono/diheme cytochrome c family protein